MRDAGDAGEGAGEGSVEPTAYSLNHPVGRQEAEVECGVDFEILNVQPGLGASRQRNHKSYRSAEERWLDSEDDVGTPEALA